MSSYPPLSNPPIQEAIIEVALTEPIYENALELEALSESFLEEFPIKREWNVREFLLDFLEGTAETRHNLKPGYRILNESETRLCHIGQEIFAYNVLRPYCGWNTFINDFSRNWNRFIKNKKPKIVSRLSLRFINNFNIPMDGWEEYLKINPLLEQEPQMVSNAPKIKLGKTMSRFQISSEAYESAGTLSVVLEPNIENQEINVIFDTDINHQEGEIHYHSEETLTYKLMQLREFKNQLFFANLPKAQELFNE